MPDYGRFCPVALSSEVLADRWTPLIVRELILGNTRFNDIARGLPGISRTLLAQRLRHLERRGVLETWPSPTGRGSEYHLTPAGKDLEPVLEAMGKWSVEWLYEDFDDDVEAVTLMWWMHRRVDEDGPPAGPGDRRVRPHRAGGHHDLAGARPRRGVGVHAAPRARTPTSWCACPRPRWRGCSAARSAGRRPSPTATWRSSGPPALAKKLPTWFLWSPWAGRRPRAKAREVARR